MILWRYMDWFAYHLSLITCHPSTLRWTQRKQAQGGACYLLHVTLRHFDELSASRLRAALVICYLSLVTCHLSLVTCYLSLVICHPSSDSYRTGSGRRLLLVTCYLLLVTCHLSLVTCYLLLVTCYLSLVTNHLPLVNRIESCVFNQCIRYSYSCFGLVVFE